MRVSMVPEVFLRIAYSTSLAVAPSKPRSSVMLVSSFTDITSYQVFASMVNASPIAIAITSFSQLLPIPTIAALLFVTLTVPTRYHAPALAVMLLPLLLRHHCNVCLAFLAYLTFKCVHVHLALIRICRIFSIFHV